MSDRESELCKEEALRIAVRLIEQEQVHVLGIKRVFYYVPTADDTLPKQNPEWVVHFECPPAEEPLYPPTEDVVIVGVDVITQKASILMTL